MDRCESEGSLETFNRLPESIMILKGQSKPEKVEGKLY